MTPPPKAILFDFGNVLTVWDPHELYKSFFPDRQAIDAFFKEINFSAWNIEQDRGRPFAEAVALLSSQFPQHAHLIRAYDERWPETVVGSIDGTVAIARRLAHAGYPLFLLTNYSAEKFRLVRPRFEFLDLFQDFIVSGEHHLVKPDPAIYHLTLKRIGRSAPECLFIDDALPNIETARSLGFETIHFQSPTQLEAELHRLHILPKPH